MKKQNETPSYTHYVNGIPCSSPLPNYCSVAYLNVMDSSTDSLPLNLRIVLLGKPRSNREYNYDQFLMLENVGAIVKVYLLSSLNASEIASQFMCSHIHCSLKYNLILSHSEFTPEVLLYSNFHYEPENAQLIYSIDLSHASVREVMRQAAKFDRSLDQGIESPFETSLEDAHKSLGTKKSSQNPEPKGSRKSIVIPTDESHRFIEITKNDIINEIGRAHV